MYTFAPIPPLDTINDHSGLVMVTGFIVLCFLIMWSTEDLDGWMLAVLCAIPIGIAAVVSYNTGTYTEYRNEQVEGTLIGFVAEGYNEARTSGKSTRRVDVHHTYVEYEVDGQRVLFSATTGQTYPKKAVLYKN